MTLVIRGTTMLDPDDDLEPLAFIDDAELPYHYEKYRTHPRWRPLYDMLSNKCYWHRTTLAGWKAISEDGEIRPNIDGRFPTCLGEDNRDYGTCIGAICLFDFHQPSMEEVSLMWSRVYDILAPLHDETECIWIRLEWNVLEPSIIQNAKAKDGVDGRYRRYIEFCEVWFPSEIPVRCISHVYGVPTSHKFSEIYPYPIPF